MKENLDIYLPNFAALKEIFKEELNADIKIWSGSKGGFKLEAMKVDPKLSSLSADLLKQYKASLEVAEIDLSKHTADYFEQTLFDVEGFKLA